MKDIACLLLLITMLALSVINPVSAVKIYRHPPFTISIGSGDTLIVDYDFPEGKGLQCTSSFSKIWIDFVYKGFPKSAALPAILQNDHVPQKTFEELADAEGQLSLFINREKIDDKRYPVNCRYLSLTGPGL